MGPPTKKPLVGFFVGDLQVSNRAEVQQNCERMIAKRSRIIFLFVSLSKAKTGKAGLVFDTATKRETALSLLDHSSPAVETSSGEKIRNLALVSGKAF